MAIGSGLRWCLPRNLTQPFPTVHKSTYELPQEKKTWKCKIKPQRINCKATQLPEEENDKYKTRETGLQGLPALFGDRYSGLSYTPQASQTLEGKGARTGKWRSFLTTRDLPFEAAWMLSPFFIYTTHQNWRKRACKHSVQFPKIMTVHKKSYH